MLLSTSDLGVHTETIIPGSPHNSTDDLVGVIRTVSFRRCSHPKSPQIWGDQDFQISSFTHPNIVELQFCGQYFNITTESLGATWAGRFILYRHGYWSPLLQGMFKKNDTPFRLEKAPTGYLVEGSCCVHSCHICHNFDDELKGSWEGRMLLAEHDGEWKEFMEYLKMLSLRKFNRLVEYIKMRLRRRANSAAAAAEAPWNHV
ncbi:hypothetical protein EAF04_005948 [Stromatinia cepivora]|nr:hypothetical protein EAF04_005948 [Stromatinia cepivora]